MECPGLTEVGKDAFNAHVHGYCGTLQVEKHCVENLRVVSVYDFSLSKDFDAARIAFRDGDRFYIRT